MLIKTMRRRIAEDALKAAPGLLCTMKNSYCVADAAISAFSDMFGCRPKKYLGGLEPISDGKVIASPAFRMERPGVMGYYKAQFAILLLGGNGSGGRITFFAYIPAMFGKDFSITPIADKALNIIFNATMYDSEGRQSKVALMREGPKGNAEALLVPDSDDPTSMAESVEIEGFSEAHKNPGGSPQ